MASRFSPHYSGSYKLAVVEVDPRRRTVRRRMIVVRLESEPCSWLPLLRPAGVNLVLSGGTGRGAQVRLAEHGIKVFAGVPPAAPDGLVAAWLDERLVVGENAGEGNHHRHGEHGHHHHADDCNCSH